MNRTTLFDAVIVVPIEKWKSITLTLLLTFFGIISANLLNAQWLDFSDETATRLVLTSVANSDDEEKDIEAGDFNNDGLMDVIVVRKEPFSISTEGAKSDLLLMNVNGVLTDQTSQYAPEFISAESFARDLVISDFDDDGWLDVVIANTFGEQPKYYQNQGEDVGGNWLGFVDESATRFPLLTEFTPLFCAVWAGDVNGDGEEDIYFCNYSLNGGGGTARDYLLMNDGAGNFTDESAARLGDLRNSAFGTAVQMHDMDNDGDLDILKVSTLFSVTPWNDLGLFVLFNDGTGNYANWQNIAPFAPYMFEVADFDGDGMLDVFVVDDGADYCLTTNSFVVDNSLNMTNTGVTSGVGGFGGNVHAEDLDNDGDMDIMVSDVDVDIPPCNSGRKLAILQNNGGAFTDLYNAGTYDWADNTYDLAILDVNGDGLMDFLAGVCEGYGVFMSDNCGLAPNPADYDQDGLADSCDPCPTNPDPNCEEPIGFPQVPLTHNVARQWNDMLLESIRLDFARPTVHARNLWHHSTMMYDLWATFDDDACTYLLGTTAHGFTCPFTGIADPVDVQAALDTAISFASYRLLSHRFQNSPGATKLAQAYNAHMDSLGMNPQYVSQDYSTGRADALGNYIAQCYIDFGLQDGSNEQNDYANTAYSPVNAPLSVDDPGNPTITDYNRWQPLTLDIFIDQSGNEIPGSTPDFLGPEWGQVRAFALDTNDRVINQRDGFDYHVYHDPSAPPLHSMDGLGGTPDYVWNFLVTAVWSGHLDATDGVMWDISPASIGDRTYPTSVAEYPSFYNLMDGGTQSNGHAINPATGAPYAPNIVPRADYARILAEFWADGPASETPPGHWFTIANYVSDHPDVSKQFKGVGPVLGDMEWDIKAYFALGGAMHDCAVTAWGIKGWYDYLRPISAIRALAELGQSSDPVQPNYHAAGLPLIPGTLELIGPGDPLEGASGEHIDKLKIKAWRGHKAINNVDTDEAGVDWIRIEDWVPYQRPSFVTPPFAGYISGHSTFSRAAAIIMENLTGDEYFPGGMGEFIATQDEFLVFEDGPSQSVTLQWATYRDAADESGLSRIWGGIHPPADDIPGRAIGVEVGNDAFALAESYFIDTDNDGSCDFADAPCQGDINGDGLRTMQDLLLLLGAYGCLSDCGPEDLNGDGIVGVLDLIGIMIPNFGIPCD